MRLITPFGQDGDYKGKDYTICLVFEKISQWILSCINTELPSVNQIGFELINIWMNYSDLPFVIDTKMLVLSNLEDVLTYLMN